MSAKRGEHMKQSLSSDNIPSKSRKVEKEVEALIVCL